MLGILFLGAGLGVAVGLPLMLLRRGPDGRISGQAMLPFGYFLALATPIVEFFGQALWLGTWGSSGSAGNLRRPRSSPLPSIPPVTPPWPIKANGRKGHVLGRGTSFRRIDEGIIRIDRMASISQGQRYCKLII